MVEESQIKIAFGGEGVDQDDIALYSRALHRMLEDAIPNAEVAQMTRPRTLGEKGDPVTFGTIIIALIASGAVKAMIECIGAVIIRDKRLKIEVTLKDGSHVTVDSTNIGDENIINTLKKVL